VPIFWPPSDLFWVRIQMLPIFAHIVIHILFFDIFPYLVCIILTIVIPPEFFHLPFAARPSMALE